MIKTIVLAAPPETVWAFLTEGDKLGIWFHAAEADLVEGGEFALVSSEKSGDVDDRRICWGTVLEMDKPRRLVYTFTVKPLGGRTTQVSWELEAFRDGTRLTMSHDGIEEAAGDAAFGMMQALDKGWDEHFGTLRGAVA